MAKADRALSSIPYSARRIPQESADLIALGIGLQNHRWHTRSSLPRRIGVDTSGSRNAYAAASRARKILLKDTTLSATFSNFDELIEGVGDDCI